MTPLNHPAPPTVHTIAEVRAAVAAARRGGHAIGFVPTMGALHAGHISLVDAAKQRCGFVVVSIFVNPTQFGPHEDYDQYPRTLAADQRMLASAATDLVFAPSAAEVYPAGHCTYVDLTEVTDTWEGAHRPGHFRGVATVVLKLFNMVQPDMAFFGQKDYQQSLVIRRLVQDLNLPLQIQVCPTLRDPDGLAMSSRNAYLSTQERQQALVLSRALRHAENAVRGGTVRADRLRAELLELFAAEPAVKLEYLAIVDPDTLASVELVSGDTLFALAARVGKTRLIDNALISAR